MYEGSAATLKMERSILRDGLFDEDEHEARILRYRDQEEYMYLSVEDFDLPEFSLDAVYECYIQEEKITCLGIIVERYRQSGDCVIKFKIQNGFYKKEIN